MVSSLSFENLLEYTEWERQKWLEWMRQQERPVLEITAGPDANGRFGNVGDLVRHIFSAEKRYVDRLSDRPLTAASGLPPNDVEALFEFGARSRRDLREYVQGLSAEDGDTPRELPFMNNILIATPRKLITHVLMHEIRHWAQIATLLRLNGLKVDMHDFLFSPVFGGELRRGAPSP